MTDPASPGKALPHLAGISVLIVDDSAAVRQRVAESLASIPGVEVAGEAADVPAGRRLLDEIKPGVLVLDIDLPTQSGMELLKLAKRQPDAPVVIMLSIHHEAPFRQKCAELGADFFFHKLSEFDKVADVCRQMADDERGEAQRIRAQRMERIGTLACGIAHDLNNVLSPILTSCELLSSPLADDDRQELLIILRQSAQRGAGLVRQLLSFCRGVKGECVELPVGPLLDEVRHIVSQTFPKSIELQWPPAPELWTVSGDPTQLHQVILNLCINARDAMPNGGVLTLSAENAWLPDQNATAAAASPPRPHVLVTIRDTGTGIPAELRDRIFEPFFTTKDSERGTGLGLFTSLGIIQNHGGSIVVDSKPGKGSVFQIRLPALAASR